MLKIMPAYCINAYCRGSPEVFELRLFMKMFEFFSFSSEGCQGPGECSKEWLRLGKKDFSRFDDLHRLRTSCKGFRVRRAESSDENGGKH